MPTPPLYVNVKTAIEKLDSSIANIYAKSVSNAPFAWKRDNMLVLRVGNLMFSYSKAQTQQGEIIIAIHEVMENGQIVNEIQEKIKRIVSETIHNYLKNRTKKNPTL